MKKLVILCVLLLGGCAQIQKDWNIVTGATVSPAAVIVAGNAYDALEVTATSYLQFCKANRPLAVCSSYVAARRQILPAIRAGRVARNNLEAFLVANPGQLGPSGLYNVLIASINTVQGVISQYNLTASGASK